MNNVKKAFPCNKTVDSVGHGQILKLLSRDNKHQISVNSCRRDRE